MRFNSRSAAYALVSAVGSLIVSVNCNTTSPTDPLPAPVDGTTITITSAGASPRSIQVVAGQRVLFVNNDSRSHNMTSDPHPEHDACPEINQVGYLSPGQSRETGNLVTPETCGFHDHDNPDTQNLHGQIAIK